MIGRIRGVLVEKHAPEIVIEVGGIAYEIQAPMSVFYKILEVGTELILYTHFIVREDAQLLYGFNTKNERELFRTLIKVNGVGPKLGLTLLSGIECHEFVRCVNNNDSDTLVKLPGVGKKTAERLIVEMRGKLDKWITPPLLKGVLSNMSESADNTILCVEEEAVSALVSLGYKPQQATKVVKTLYCDGVTSEELIRKSLKSMV